MFYEEIRTKQDLSYMSLCSLSILYNSKIHFNGNIFGNKCCHCHKGLLYMYFQMHVYRYRKFLCIKIIQLLIQDPVIQSAMETHLGPIVQSITSLSNSSNQLLQIKSNILIVYEICQSSFSAASQSI